MAIEEVDASPEEFRAASTWLSSTPAAAGLPNEVKLEVAPLWSLGSALCSWKVAVRSLQICYDSGRAVR